MTEDRQAAKPRTSGLPGPVGVSISMILGSAELDFAIRERHPTTTALHRECISLHHMDGVAALSSAIGGRVKQERRARSLTLDQLAGAAGVSRRALVNVEQGVANPSVGILLRISDALGIDLPALVEPPSTDAVQVTRSGHGALLWTGDAGGSGMVVASFGAPAFALWDWTLEPGDRRDSEAHRRGCRELLHVHQGTVTVEVGDRSVALDAGDAAAFISDASHSYANPGATAARFTLAVYEPGATPHTPT